MAETYRVTSQIESRELDDHGRVFEAVRVSFTSEWGAGTVNVPKTHYEPEVVRQLVEDQVARLRAVAEL